MTGLSALIRRNTKLYFKDKGMFFTSLITPVILLVLYVTFLGRVYRSSFASAVPEGFFMDESVINAAVGGQLVSSLLAVCCVTVAFCSNLLSVQDKISGARLDLAMTPVKRGVLAAGYFIASALSTLIICSLALAVCLVYLGCTGWYLSVADVALLFGDVFLLVLFGTALSSVINYPLSTAGQGSAVGTIASAGYGFVCGAYMPISQFSVGLQRVLSFLPGTYGTSLVRNHAMGGVFEEMVNAGFPDEAIKGIKDTLDCNLYFFESKVETGVMYAILTVTVVVLVGIYIAMNVAKAKRSKGSV